MSIHDARVLRVRQVLAATGGWNARSRAALVTWARAEGLGEAEFRRVLESVLGRSLPAPSSAPPVAQTRPQAGRSGGRRWLALLAVIGLATSIAMLRILVERVARAPVRSTTSSASRVTEPEPARTLPPAPVSFPTPPELGSAQVPPVPMALDSLGPRAPGALARADMQLWSERVRALCAAWTDMPLERREAVLASIAAWMAQAADESELAEMRRELASLESTASDPRMATLGSALQVMVLAQVAASDRLSPIVAGDQAFSQGSSVSAADALVAWTLDQVPALVGGLGSAEARARWSGWLDALGVIDRPQDRTSIALAAIDALLRSSARLDTQGLAADAIGSLVRTVPPGREGPGFEMVVERMVRWLEDSNIPAERLWALGGIWRSVAEPPDERLLVGERDSMSARASLAQRWRALSSGPAVRPWQSLADRLAEPLPGPDSPIVRRIDALTARLTLLRGIDALVAGRDPAQVTPADPLRAAARWSEIPDSIESRWARPLLSQKVEERMRALQSMRSAGLPALAAADVQALANRALSAPSREERQLAQQLIRETLLDSALMRVALAREIAVAADPRHALDLLQDLGGFDLPTEDVAALRAAALAAVLSSLPPGSSLEPVADALARLEAEVDLWAGAVASESPDAGRKAWGVAARVQAASGALRPLPPLDAAVQGAADRIRRLQRLAPEGPRAFAGAVAVISDLEAARLAVQRASEQAVIERFIAGVSADRARAADAIEQAGISLVALGQLRLASLGAPLPSKAAGGSIRPSAKSDSDGLARVEARIAGDGPDSPAARQAMVQLLAQDDSLAGSAALLLAKGSSDPQTRRVWIEQAQALGMIAPGEPGPSRQATLALAQLLSAAERGQLDRVIAPRRGSPGQAELERFARAQGVPVESLLISLRTSTDPAREPRLDSLREWVLHALDPGARPWLGALSGGDAHRMPEADAAQRARMIPSIE